MSAAGQASLSHCVPGMQIDFNAKNEYDFINNYKVLQAAFLKLNVDKVCSGPQQHRCSNVSPTLKFWPVLYADSLLLLPFQRPLLSQPAKPDSRGTLSQSSP